MRFLVLFLLLFSTTFAKDYIYFLPDDSKEFRYHLSKLINNSKKSIDISMYNFSYKDIAKELKHAIKDGVDVEVIFDSQKIKDEKSQYKYLKKSGAKVYIADKKLHTKIAIFDKKHLLFGSMNWSEKSFSKSYEIVYITDNEKMINKTLRFLEKIKR